MNALTATTLGILLVCLGFLKITFSPHIEGINKVQKDTLVNPSRWNEKPFRFMID